MRAAASFICLAALCVGSSRAFVVRGASARHHRPTTRQAAASRRHARTTARIEEVEPLEAQRLITEEGAVFVDVRTRYT